MDRDDLIIYTIDQYYPWISILNSIHHHEKAASVDNTYSSRHAEMGVSLFSYVAPFIVTSIESKTWAVKTNSKIASVVQKTLPYFFIVMAVVIVYR